MIAGFFFGIAICFSSFPAAIIDSFKIVHHHFPITCYVWRNDDFVITGTPRTFIDSSNELKPPPIAICLQTVAKLLIQCALPVRPVVLVDVLKSYLLTTAIKSAAHDRS